MQEQQVTVDGITRQLPRPFMVLATQNPIEYEGTFPLPEAQLDRFLIRLSIGYPSSDDEQRILNILRREHPIINLQPIPPLSGLIGRVGSETTIGQLLMLQRKVWDVHVDETLQAYIVLLVERTRQHPDLTLGASPRASLALFKTAQALAAVRGRDFVIPEDIKYLAPITITHRLIVRPESELRGRNARTILEEIIHSTPLDIGEKS
jgi:MoxR-like ATPase